MLQFWVLVLITIGYLSLLFAIAYYAERSQRLGRSLVANPIVYSLSLAVYCTSWTFYGSVGKATQSGLLFMTIYIGPTLMAILFGVLLKKMINVAKEHRLTTIADFVGSRYGNSIALSALVTIIASIGISPYLGLQIKAIIATFSILVGESQATLTVGWTIALLIGLFATIFGVRDVSEKHEGLVFAIAFESIIKLIAFLAVGIAVTFFIFDGPMDILTRIKPTEFANLLNQNGSEQVDYREWVSLLILSMMAILLLPRQFHMAVVENHDVKHVNRAMWLFPLYMFLINLFVLPVALGGLLLNGSAEGADSFVLSIPLMQGFLPLALLVFIGGFSAASGMIIVESLALSNMVMNNIVNPVVYRFRVRGNLMLMSNIKRLVILGFVFAGYLFAVYLGESSSLVDMGLISFEAVTIFAPSLILGLYWKSGNRNGALAGLIGGFVIWIYTMIFPTIVVAGSFQAVPWVGYLFEHAFLNPEALFGLDGVDRWTHTLFWQLFVNIGLYVVFSLFTRQSHQEETRALQFVASYDPKFLPARISVKQIERVLIGYIGRRETRKQMDDFLARRGITKDNLSPEDMLALKGEAQGILSSLYGSAVAALVFEGKLTYTTSERRELLTTITEMSETLRFSRRQLALLKAFSDNIVESLPLGVATLDELGKVLTWNKAMAGITGIDRDDAMNRDGRSLLKILPPETSRPDFQGVDWECRVGSRSLMGRVSRLTGMQPGMVVLLEDITERKEIEDELLLASKHAGIGRLAAGVSHEIGNPLASIFSLVQELLEEENSPFVDESLRTIYHHVDRIAKIVRSLGSFARMSSRQKVPTDLESILEKTLNLVRYDKGFKKICVETDIVPLPRLKVDPDQIQQVFLNLLLNGRDAMPDGGEMMIRFWSDEEGVYLAFADSGSGIDPRIAGQVFDPFFTTKGPTKGTGLGLSISYSIVKDHGGSIEAMSDGKKGTTFLIRLPRPV